MRAQRALHGQRHFADDKLRLPAGPILQFQRHVAKPFRLVERGLQSADKPFKILQVRERRGQGAQGRGSVHDPRCGQPLGRRYADFPLAHGRWAVAGR